jgi:hypothetical protein
MDLFTAICQAAGLGLAVGIGGPLTALFVATMAHVELGMDPEGTDWEFFASNWFIAILFAVNVAAFYANRAGVPTRVPGAVFATAIGAIAGAASLAEEGEAAAIGLLVGGLLALAASLLAADVLAGARRRADVDGETDAGGTLTLIFAAAGIAIAALALFVPPASLLVLLALVALAAARRRRAGEKYEGLRILR